MTALSTGTPSSRAARSRSERRIIAEISCGRYSWSPTRTFTSWPIFRLIDLTVRCGASTHWFRAALPTSRRPSSERPTKDGKIGSPSSAKTNGWPSRMTATSLFVVPRSIPTIGSITVPNQVENSVGHRFRDADLGVAEDAAVEQVAAAHFLHHNPGRAVVDADHLDDLHPLRVKRLPGTR